MGSGATYLNAQTPVREQKSQDNELDGRFRELRTGSKLSVVGFQFFRRLCGLILQASNRENFFVRFAYARDAILFANLKACTFFNNNSNSKSARVYEKRWSASGYVNTCQFLHVGRNQIQDECDNVKIASLQRLLSESICTLAMDMYDNYFASKQTKGRQDAVKHDSDDDSTVKHDSDNDSTVKHDSDNDSIKEFKSGGHNIFANHGEFTVYMFGEAAHKILYDLERRGYQGGFEPDSLWFPGISCIRTVTLHARLTKFQSALFLTTPRGGSQSPPPDQVMRPETKGDVPVAREQVRDDDSASIVYVGGPLAGSAVATEGNHKAVPMGQMENWDPGHLRVVAAELETPTTICIAATSGQLTDVFGKRVLRHCRNMMLDDRELKVLDIRSVREALHFRWLELVSSISWNQSSATTDEQMTAAEAELDTFADPYATILRHLCAKHSK
jgi:hypothetical protein